ncbi:MAG: hypothetical protein GKS07_07470 [Nitrosopumilus sp.]|nr:MAG: hypothetical protein GKS07_07470 [Nitrosopumilus sp.]
MSAVNLPEKCSEEQLKILFVLEDDISRTNAIVARILRRHRSATFRDLKILTDKKNDST